MIKYNGMKYYTLQTIEGVRHKVQLSISGVEDLSDYCIYGYTTKIGLKNCIRFEEDEHCLYIPPLSSGIYAYQIFIKRISTNQEFHVLSGKIEVANRLCDHGSEVIGSTGIEVSLDANTTVINCQITEGTKGDKGEKGDKGDGADISEETIKEMLPMVWDITTPSTTEQNFKNGVLIGENNKGGSHTNYIFGKDNEATRNKSILVGFSNLSKAYGNAIFGEINQISGQQNNVFGYSNIITSDYNQNYVFGTQNRPKSSNNVIVGEWNETFLDKNGDANFIFGESNYISGEENTTLGQTNHISGQRNTTIGYRNAVAYQSPGSPYVVNEGFNITIGNNNFVGGGVDFGFFTSNNITLGNRSSNHRTNSIVIGHDCGAKNDNSIILCASDTNNGVKVSMELTAGQATGKTGDLGSGEPFVTDCYLTFYIEDVLGGMTQRTKINLKDFLEIFSSWAKHEMIENGGYYYL